jgi:arsenate reductase (thioredoxin)
MTNRISIFTSLPITSLDRLSLQKRLDEIGARREMKAAERV